MPRITGAHLCLTNNAASAAKTVESENRPDIVTAPIGAVLIEGCDRDAVQAAVSHLLKAMRDRKVAATGRGSMRWSTSAAIRDRHRVR